MDGRDLKALWRSGRPSFGAWMTMAEPVVASVLANAGYEWVIVDAEHMPYNPRDLRDLVLLLKGRGVVPIVRVTENSPSLIKQVLDWGAEGVVVPLLHTGEDARRAAQACRYPPDGIRGWNPRDATNLFCEADYRQTFNDRVICMVQVEHIEAVQNLQDIVAVPGVDAVLIGPADLSFSMGHPLQADHPDVQQAIAQTIAGCRAARIPVGIAPGGSVADLVGWVRCGVDFLMIGFDFVWLAAGAEQTLKDMRAATGGR